MIQRVLTLAAILGLLGVPMVLMSGCGDGGDTTPDELVVPEPAPGERPPAPAGPDATEGGGGGN